MDVYKGSTPLGESELVCSLGKIVAMANGGEESCPVGVLTTTDRRIWGRTYNQLKKGNGHFLNYSTNFI